VDALRWTSSASLEKGIQNTFIDLYHLTYYLLSISSCMKEKTVVLHDSESITKALLGFYAKANTRYDCSGLLGSKTINDTLSNLRNQGVTSRQITEISKDNISYCKQLMKIVELRHMDAIKCKIELTDTELIVTTIPENVEPDQTAQVIHSNVRQLVEQHQSIFEILWKKAIPAEQKIRELEILENPLDGFAGGEEDWEYLFYYINRKETTPFLGAGIAREHFGSGSELGEKIAKEFGYPFKDTFDLAKVAQLAAIKTEDSNRIRQFVADYIKNKKLPEFTPTEPHRILANLDLPIYITTNYDHLMYEALKSAGKKPVIESCRWNDLAELQGKPTIFDEEQFNRFDFNNPLVYHIHGEIDNPQSMVLTEDDYLNFIVKLYVEIDKLFPAEIKRALVSSSILFIGYSLSDWNLRIILRKIAYSMKSAARTHCSIQLTPTDIEVKDEAKVKKHLKSYFEIIQGVNLKIFWGTALNFCLKLSEKSKTYPIQNVHTG
jgi:hypothetical protein